MLARQAEDEIRADDELSVFLASTSILEIKRRMRGLGFIASTEPLFEPLDPLLHPRAIVIDDRDLPRRVDVVLVAGHPVAPALVHNASHSSIAMLVHQTRFAIEEALDLRLTHCCPGTPYQRTNAA